MYSLHAIHLFPDHTISFLLVFKNTCLYASLHIVQISICYINTRNIHTVSVEITNKMQPYNRIYYSAIH
jgi:hypothetical protein